MHHLNELLKDDDLLFDIETTGLSAAYCHIYMIGLGYRKGDVVHIHLYYARSKDEEKEILLKFSETAKEFNRLITFNGDTFDLPFLSKRFTANHMVSDTKHLSSQDLFKTVKKYKHFLNLEHYKQKDIEQFLGIFREDTYNGGQLIEIYKKQALYPDDAEEDLLFLHNMEDIKGLVYMLSILDFSILENKEPLVHSITIGEKELSFQAVYEEPLNLSFSLLNEYGFFCIKENSLYGSLKLYDHKLKYYLPNYKDYYYVEDEELLLPKSLKHTIQKERIRKAKKEECFVLSDPNALSKEKLSVYIHQMFQN